MDTLKDQIKSRCIYFTGMGNHACKIGITYDSVKVPGQRPIKFPCIVGSSMTGGACDKRELPSEEEVEKETNEINKTILHAVNVRIAIQKKADKDQKREGTIKCLSCEGVVSYVIAGNGHVWAKCDKCGLAIME